MGAGKSGFDGAHCALGRGGPCSSTEKIMGGLSAQNNPHNAPCHLPAALCGRGRAKRLWLALEDMRDPRQSRHHHPHGRCGWCPGIILVGQSCDPWGGLRARHHGFDLRRAAGAHHRGFHRLCRAWPGEWSAPISRPPKISAAPTGNPPSWSWAARARACRTSCRRLLHPRPHSDAGRCRIAQCRHRHRADALRSDEAVSNVSPLNCTMADFAYIAFVFAPRCLARSGRLSHISGGPMPRCSRRTWDWASRSIR